MTTLHAHPPTTVPSPSVHPRREVRHGLLIVDDEVAYLDLLEQVLGEHLACPVFGFSKPWEALDHLPSLPISLVVTDYSMPRMDGFEFLAEVARVRPDLPAVMITSHDVEITARHRRRLPQLKTVVRKPFRWQMLAEAIANHWPGTAPKVH